MPRHRLCLSLLLCVSAQFAGVAFAQTASGDKPWFGIALPPKFGAEPAVVVGPRDPHPAIFSSGVTRYAEFDGATIRKDVAAIVEFSQTSRRSHEIGSGQLWGRVSGFASSIDTVEWAAEQLRRAGIADVKLQPIEQESRTPFWIPESWEVRLLGDAALGTGSAARVCWRRKSRAARSHRREGKNRRAIDRSARTHGVRA